MSHRLPPRRARGQAPGKKLLLAACLMLLGAATLPWPAAAGVTETWTRDGAAFRAGEFDGVQLTPGGHLAARPARDEVDRPESASLLWDVLLVGGDVWVAGGEDLGLWRHPAEGEPVRIDGLGDAPEVFALARAPGGGVFAATGPEGAVYRVGADGAASLVFEPPARYVWDLVPDADGGLLVATGLPGRVYRVDSSGGEPEMLWQTDDPHVRCLAHDPSAGRVLAGTSGSGWLVGLAPGEEPFVLWDSERPEIVAVELASDGALWIAAAGRPGEAQAGGTGEPKRAEVEQKGSKTTVVVRARADDDGNKAGSGKSDGKPADAGGLPKGGGEVVRRSGEGLVRTVWKSGSDTPLALLPRDDGMLVAAGKPGRVWWIGPRGETGWWDVLEDRDVVTALAGTGDEVAAVTSHPASVLRYGATAASPARWTSDVLDTEVGARFGRVHAVTESGQAGRVRVSVRSGNTSEPNGGWSPWREVSGAAAPPDATGGVMGLPAARFLQVRVEIASEVPPSRGLVQRVVARYRKHNRPPQIPKLEVLPLGVAYRALPPAQERSGKDPVVDPMIRAELQEELHNKNDDWRPKKAYEPGALTVRWKASDPDGDQLHYRVEACRDAGDGSRCEDATLLAEELPRDFFSFDSRALPDGIYRFRVVASDAASNHLGEILTTEQVSDPFVVDHTPPRIEQASARLAGDPPRLEVTATAEDPAGRLVRAEVSIDPGEWYSLAPEDGVEDGARERFAGTLPEDPGQRAIVLRVVDRAGNVATQRLTVR